MLLALEKGELAERVVNVSLVMGAIAFTIGLVLLLVDWVTDRQLRILAKKTTRELASGGPEMQGLTVPDLGESINALATLAKALKALDRSTRLLVVSLIFLAIAAVGAFVDV